MLLEIHVRIMGRDPAIKPLAQEAEDAGDRYKRVALHEVPSDPEEPYRLQFTVFDGDTMDGWADSVDRLLAAFGAKISALKHSSADVAFACRANAEDSEPFVHLNARTVRGLAECGVGLVFERRA